MQIESDEKKGNEFNVNLKYAEKSLDYLINLIVLEMAENEK